MSEGNTGFHVTYNEYLMWYFSLRKEVELGFGHLLVSAGHDGDIMITDYSQVSGALKNNDQRQDLTEWSFTAVSSGGL